MMLAVQHFCAPTNCTSCCSCRSGGCAPVQQLESRAVRIHRIEIDPVTLPA